MRSPAFYCVAELHITIGLGAIILQKLIFIIDPLNLGTDGQST